MSDIYTDPQLIERRWKTVIKKVIIINPSTNIENSTRELIFDIEKVPYDNNIPKYDESKKQSPLKINMDQSSDIFTIFDPITRQNITISTIGLYSALEEAFTTWIQK
jgi:hypothetical protein